MKKKYEQGHETFTSFSHLFFFFKYRKFLKNIKFCKIPGAYGAIMEEDNAGDKFCEEDIDQILERRTQVITLESEKGSTFSKASFASSGIRQDIDIDDPDFWKKWAKKAEIDPTERDDMVLNFYLKIPAGAYFLLGEGGGGADLHSVHIPESKNFAQFLCSAL